MQALHPAAVRGHLPCAKQGLQHACARFDDVLLLQKHAAPAGGASEGRAPAVRGHARFFQSLHGLQAEDGAAAEALQSLDVERGARGLREPGSGDCDGDVEETTFVADEEGSAGALHGGDAPGDFLDAEVLQEMEEVVRHEHLGLARFPCQVLPRQALLLLDAAHGGFHEAVAERAVRRRRVAHPREDLEEFSEAVEAHADGETLLADVDVLEDARVVELVEDEDRVEDAGLQRVVGLDAAHVARRGGVQHLDELLQLRLEVRGSGVEQRKLAGAGSRPEWVGAIKVARQDLVGGGSERFLDVVMELILVLLEHAGDGVVDRAGEVVEAEALDVSLGAFDDLEVLVELLRGEVENLVEKVAAVPAGHHALLVEQREDAGRLGLQGLDANQRVTRIVEVGVRNDAFLRERLALDRRNALVELHLQLLVTVVDQQLLQAIRIENLEPGLIQNRNRQLRVHLIQPILRVPLLLRRRLQQVIQPRHDDPKQRPIQHLRQRVPRLHRLRVRVPPHERLPRHLDLPTLQRRHQRARLHPQQSRNHPGVLLARDLRALVVLLVLHVDKLEVPEEQHRGEHGEDPVALLLAEAEAGHRVFCLGEAGGVVDAGDGVGVFEVAVVGGGGEDVEEGAVGLGCAGDELVEDVEGALGGGVVDDAGELEEVLADVGAADAAGGVVEDADELAEAGGVGVAGGFGVAEGLEEGVGEDDFALDGGGGVGGGGGVED
mmetsp:Transcript_14966/g.40174  ORF Transcript_14966/g.40174 Transcript_14966/m.40174 type:complete len:721 (-) Transcript_14966:573-2735(-)